MGSRIPVADLTGAERHARRTAHYVADNPHIVNQIVERDLCVRCGACEPACPVDIIRFDDNAYPYITDEDKCARNCVRCLKVCPGEEVDLTAFDERMFGTSPDPRSVTGIVNHSWVSHATDNAIREQGASGGFVTQLLSYLIEHDIIDGALVLGADLTEQGGWTEKPFIARTVDDLRRSMKSKYRVLPFLRSIKEMEEIEGRYAVVALPCYVHALRKYQRVSPKLRERLTLIIGLLCNVAFEPKVFDELCEFGGISPNDVKNLEFRGGEWPGGIYADMHDGSRVKALKLEDMKDEFNTLKQFYTPLRCNMCMDFSAEHADLAVGDPWLRGTDGQYLFPEGWTSIVTRTRLADRLLAEAQDAGYIHLEPVDLEVYMANFERSASYKRKFVPAHIAIRKRLGLPTPDFGRPDIKVPLDVYAAALVKMVISWFARSKSFRRFGVAFAQTRPVVHYLRWNRRRKARKFSEAHAANLEFARSISPPPSMAEGEHSGFEVRSPTHRA